MSETLVLPAGPEAIEGDPSRDIRLGTIIAVAFFVVFLGWAALVPLDAGVTAAGQIAVAGNRQSVQHRDGGVITAINVREGQHVKAGSILIELSAPELKASERALTSDYLTLLAQRARLMAERMGKRDFAPPPEFASLSPEDRDIAMQVMALQRSELRARSGSVSAQQSVLGQRAKQLGEQQGGYVKQRESLREQQRLIAEELAGLKSVAEKGFASMNRVRALERAQAELQGQEAQMVAEYARAGQGIGETRMQSLSVSSDRLAQVENDLKDTQSKLSEVLPKLVATREQLQHSQVRAPATGQVVGLQVFTVGGVVTPGQKLMDIVPDGKELVIQAQLSPTDADDVYAGQKAQIRFASVHNRTLPLFTGTVRTVSADSFSDEKTGRSFFRVELVVPEAELNRVRSVLGNGELRPGLPVEAVLTVRKRTALQYLLEPLTGALWRSGHED
ncbi:HlyD family type I secretion periplasmic adaptor subunit [Sphingomonas flavescens]|uniref:HlyD family type I secretion periplasmic adaptor subunit n=1 Tax=Sphingomonas flavescens TaxID=3132797 RepID=UPI002804FA1A|nr:HlyD family type I secretion periplasmic adaptor subunit [Sphingomonas limnosediminicola]